MHEKIFKSIHRSKPSVDIQAAITLPPLESGEKFTLISAIKGTILSLCDPVFVTIFALF
jgi:hypothetical protein